ncbi:MAG: transglycosylase SLT domain-containing protein [bacterium]|nr:transglycosylase SLT domain-containing protein [bacterium]
MPIARLTALLFVLFAANFPACLIADEFARASLFPRPPGLVPAIAFWTRVYTKLDSASGIVHDSRRLDRVYQIRYLNPDAPPAAQTKVIEKTLQDYRAALLALASGKRRGLTTIEQQALLPWGESAPKTELRNAAERLRFQRGQADRIKGGLARSKRWKKHIQALFRKRSLPPELAALPHVESSYNPDALSKAGAAGLWQFMPATARRYLRVDATVDERLDPYKSSTAAAHLLQHNHSVLKSWPLAITAYNYGLSGVRRAVRETGTEELDVIIQSYEHVRFGFASRNFYAAFLAALDVSENPQHYFNGSQPAAPKPIVLVTQAYLPTEVLVEAFAVDKKQLRKLNPSLHHQVWNAELFVPEGHALKLPGTLNLERTNEILALLSQYFGFSSQVPYRYYDVRTGDTLSMIAESHESNTPTLRSMNRLSSADRIYAGQVLRVPMGPLPEPLGAGAALMLAARRTKDGMDGGNTLALDVRRLIADATGQATAGVADPEPAQSRFPADACREASSAIPTDGTTGSIKTESTMADSSTETQPALVADPNDYGVLSGDRVEIQINETIGHYTEWLDLSSDRLAQLNHLDRKKTFIAGRLFKLDFSHETPKRFEQQRVAYHQSLQLAYFRRYRIVGVLEHSIIDGDNLWMLAVHQYRIPMWLLRQYNPDIDADTVLPINSIVFVPVVAALPKQPPCVREEAY